MQIFGSGRHRSIIFSNDYANGALALHHVSQYFCIALYYSWLKIALNWNLYLNYINITRKRAPQHPYWSIDYMLYISLPPRCIRRHDGPREPETYRIPRRQSRTAQKCEDWHLYYQTKRHILYDITFLLLPQHWGL